MQRIKTIELLLAPQDDAFQTKDADFLGPFFQGALMERIDLAYASRLHQLPFNPYSQYVTADERSGKLLWRVSVLNEEAASFIVQPLLDAATIELRTLSTTFAVDQSHLEQLQLKSLTDQIYAGGESKVSVRFVTPAAFKSRGEYVIVPSVRLIFQNLLMRYEQAYTGNKEIDFETIEYLDAHTKITSYNLRSRYFSNIGQKSGKIPAFAGSMTFAFSGSQTIVGLARMLLMFGTYAGVGIKTSMGMGAMVIP